MSMFRPAPAELVKCPACNGTGVRVERDERGEIPEPEKALGSIYSNADYATACRWCAGSGRILNRKARAFEDALHTLNAQRMLVEPEGDA